MTFTRDLAWQNLDLQYRSSIAHQYARYALGLNYEMLPQNVVHQAKRCLLDASRAGKHVTIFGDYDADGICAASLLMRCFDHLGTPADVYIPHRVEEGYGLSCEALQELADRGTDLVVTVDCGIRAVEEAAFARGLGMEMVITDHHEPGEEKPDAAHVLNPKLSECGLGYENLAGVGVAFKLMWALGQQLSEGQRVSEQFKDLLMEALSLVAVGTIADVVPLLDENRVLTRYGLKALAVSARPGLRALIAVSRLRRGDISAHDVAFRLAPRLNAAGRMGDAKAAVEMLTTTDEGHAADLAEHLEKQNRLRISTQNVALREAQELLAQSGQLDRAGCIVLAGSGSARAAVLVSEDFDTYTIGTHLSVVPPPSPGDFPTLNGPSGWGTPFRSHTGAGLDIVISAGPTGNLFDGTAATGSPSSFIRDRMIQPDIHNNTDGTVTWQSMFVSTAGNGNGAFRVNNSNGGMERNRLRRATRRPTSRQKASSSGRHNVNQRRTPASTGSKPCLMN